MIGDSGFFKKQPIDGPRILLPVLHGSRETIKNLNWVWPQFDKHPHADITSEKFLDDLIVLLAWIQAAINAQPYDILQKRLRRRDQSFN